AVMSPSELLEKKKEHQRMLNRMKQKRLRHRYLLEKQQLQDQAQNLTERLSMIKVKDIIMFTTRKNLLNEYQSTRNLAQMLTEWVASTVPRTLSQLLAWVNTALFADREARKLGMDWYSQHLYHNTNRMVEFAGFPSDNKLADFNVVEVSNGKHNLIGRIQYTYDMPLEQTYEALKGRIWSALRGDTAPHVSEFLDQDLTHAIDKEMLYRRAVLSVDEANYYICRVFYSEDRIIFSIGYFFAEENTYVNVKAYAWFTQHRTLGGEVDLCYQFIPDLSYTDSQTLYSLRPEDRDLVYR
ncbi:hypothetical protein THRCLA_21881, partial [Thraustotheca clavata]